MNSKDIDFENLPVYVIHVLGNDERYDFIKNQSEKLGSKNINIVGAVTPETIKDFSIFSKYSDLSVLSDVRDQRNACCTLSHRLVHETAKKNGDEYFLILEDDFKILDSFDGWKLKAKEKSFDFDIMPMGGYSGWYNDSVWYENTDDEEIQIVKQVTCSVANLYTKKGSNQFIEMFDKVFNIENYEAADGFHHKYVFSSVVTKSLFPLPIKTHASISQITHAHADHESYYNEYFKTRSH